MKSGYFEEVYSKPTYVVLFKNNSVQKTSSLKMVNNSELLTWVRFRDHIKISTLDYCFHYIHSLSPK